MPAETADVVIVVAHADDKPDFSRIGHRETWPYPQARSMVETGEARWLDDPRNVDDGWPVDDTPEPVAEPTARAGRWAPKTPDVPDKPTTVAE